MKAVALAGLMLGPMFLGWIADVSSVRVALHVNALLLVLTMVYFGVVAAEKTNGAVHSDS